MYILIFPLFLYLSLLKLHDMREMLWLFLLSWRIYYVKKSQVSYSLFRFFACALWSVQKQIYYCLIKLHLDFNMFTTKVLWRYEIEGYRIPRACVYFRPAAVFLNRDCIIYEQPVYSSSYALPTRQCSHIKLLPECNIIFSPWWLFRHGDVTNSHLAHDAF